MKFFATLVFPLALAAQQPVITSLTNSASYTPAPLPGSAIAPGSIFVVFGSNLGPAQLVQGGFPLQPQLAGVRVLISAGGTELSAFPLYASAGQLAAILPSNTPIPPVGNALARVIYDGRASDPFPFTLARNAPGLFTLNAAGRGPAVLTDADFNALTWNRAAQPGQTVIAWGTGLGAITSPDNQPAPVFDPPLVVELLVGGRPATVRYRGRAPGYAGLDQIVFDIPPGVRGCGVSLVLRVGVALSNFASIPVAAPGEPTCTDPNGLAPRELTTVPSRGLRTGSITLTRLRSFTRAAGLLYETREDSAVAAFDQYSAGTLLSSLRLGAISFGNCTVQTFREQSANDPAPSTPLDAGPGLTFQGPLGSRTVLRLEPGFYGGWLGESIYQNNLLQPGGIPGIPFQGGGLPAFLDPGVYTAGNGTGGGDVGGLLARVTVPAAIEWTNIADITSVSRARDLTIRWSGGNPATDFVTVTGSAARGNVEAVFACTAAAGDGQLRVPPEVLALLPPTELLEGVPTGSLTVYNAPLRDAARFVAPGIDWGIVRYQLATTTNVGFE